MKTRQSKRQSLPTSLNSAASKESVPTASSDSASTLSQSDMSVTSAEGPNMANQNINNNMQHVGQLSNNVELSSNIQPSLVSTRDIKLQPYSKDDDAQQWLNMFDTFAMLKGWNDTTKAMSLPFYVKDLDWFHPLTPDAKSKWCLLSQAFLETFALSRAEKYAKLQALLNRRQLPDEKVADYLQAMQRESNLLQRSEDQLLEAAVQGLQSDIKRHIIMRDCRTFLELKSAACLIETAEKTCTSEPKQVAAVGYSNNNNNTNNSRQHFSSNNRGFKVKRLQAGAGKCSRCGRSKHGEGQVCPAMGKICNKCNRPDHFRCMCRTKVTGTFQSVPSSESAQQSQH